MIKNQSNIYQFPMCNVLGQGVTGLAPTVKISKDGGAFAASTNSVTEPDTTNAPGLYQLVLTQTECNCDTMTLVVNVPTGEWGAIMEQETLTSASSGGGATAQEVWEYSGGRTVTNTIPSASDNATAVWGAQTKEVTIATAQADTFATASALTTVGNNVSAVKAKTDNLPQSPAAVGSEMALTSAAIASVKDGLATISATNALAGGLNTLANYGDAHWSTAAGFATPSDVTAAVEAITAALPSDYAKATDVSSAQTALTALINSVLSGIFHWQVEGSILTIYNASNVAIGAYTLTKDSNGNITAVTPIVQPEPETNNAE